MSMNTENRSETLAAPSDVQNIVPLLETILGNLDAIEGCDIAALRIDEAIHLLRELADPQD